MNSGDMQGWWGPTREILVRCFRTLEVSALLRQERGRTVYHLILVLLLRLAMLEQALGLRHIRLILRYGKEFHEH